MAQKKMKALPTVLRNPVMMAQITDWMRARLDEQRKAEHDAGRGQRFRATDMLIKAAIAEIERNANAKIGDHLDGV